MVFRLGATSYVVAGDLVANVEHLGGQVQDIELILFSLPDGTHNLPDTAMLQQMKTLARLHRLSFTVHLPHDLRYTPGRLDRSLRLAERIIHLTEPLEPYAYVFHLDEQGLHEPGWVEQGIAAIRYLVAQVGVPEYFALENLESYRPDLLEPVFAALPIQRTLDIGHLWKAGLDPLLYLEHWLPQSRVVHLHGMAATDHQSLAVMPPAKLDPVVQRLREWPGVLTLEVFEGDFATSVQALQESLARVG
jgi:sugar phosphate isomerase/epimerase